MISCDLLLRSVGRSVDSLDEVIYFFGSFCLFFKLCENFNLSALKLMKHLQSFMDFHEWKLNLELLKLAGCPDWPIGLNAGFS